jgi:predicted regulator of Ras-like GTPase activity (Roadblock/LC7/MglB family)
MGAAVGEKLVHELAASDRHEIVTWESSLIASTTMEAARALADLVEISPQIEAAAVVAGDGEPAGSVGVPDGREGVLARAVRELLDGASAFRSDHGRVTQLHASLADGDVFAVAEDERTIVAVTRELSAPGLVFYDLKHCLATLDEPSKPPGGEADAEA